MTGIRLFGVRPSRRLLRQFARFRRACEGIAAVEFALILPLMLLLYLGSAETTQAVMASRKAAVAARTMSDLVGQQTANTNMTDTMMGNIFNAAATIMQPFGTGTSALTIDVAAVSFKSFTAAPSPTSLNPYVYVPTKSATASTFTPTSTDPGYAAKIRWVASPALINASTAGSTTLSNAAVTMPDGAARVCSSTSNQPLTPQTSTTATPKSKELQAGLHGSGSMVIADISYTYTPIFGASILQYAWSTTSGMSTTNTTYMQPRNTWSVCSEASGTGASDTWVCYPTRETGTCASY